MEDFAGLDNVELSFIYHRFNDFKASVDQQLDKGHLLTMVELPGLPGPFGSIPAMRPICKEHAQQAKETLFYQTLSSLLVKLRPVVEFIDEVDPSLKDQLRNGPEPC